jgi:hypothetical protein
LHVIYYHTPDWPTSPASLFELRYQYSPDSGATFHPSMRVSDTSFVSHADFMGEYHICLSDNDYLYAIWTDGRNGDDNDLYFSKAQLSLLSLEEGKILAAQSHRLISVPTIWRGNIFMEIREYSHPVEIRAYDVTGRLIKNIYTGQTEGAQRVQVQSRDFPSGVIFIQAHSNGIREWHKIVNVTIQ